VPEVLQSHRVAPPSAMVHPRLLRGYGAQSAPNVSRSTAIGLGSAPRPHFPHALFCGTPLSSRRRSPQNRYIEVGYKDNALLVSNLHFACQYLRHAPSAFFKRVKPLPLYLARSSRIDSDIVVRKLSLDSTSFMKSERKAVVSSK
jgi:hypothetical protein